MKQIIVYDQKKYFFRFIKSKFKNEYEVIKHVNICNSNSAKEIKFSFVVFVVYEEEDIIAFLNYYTLSDRIIVCSESQFILDKFKEIDNVYFLNIGVLKNRLYSILDFKFKLLESTQI